MKRQPKKSLPGEPAAPNVARITRFKQDREFCGLSQRNRLLPSWDVVRLPAIAGADELHQVETVFGMQCFGRRAGEALHAGREPPEMLAQLRRTLGEYNFAGQYQQAPTPLGGGMVKAAWFKTYATNELPEKFDQIVQSWDTANKASELSDFSVCTSWGIRGKNLYLLHVMRRRMEYPELKRVVREQCAAFAANVVLIE